MTQIPFNLPVYDHPAMLPETRDALTRLAGLKGVPHFSLTWLYDKTLSSPDRIIDVSLKAWDENSDLQTYTLKQAANMLDRSILAEARFQIEIDPHIRELLHWLQTTHDFPFGGYSESIVMSLYPGITRLSYENPSTWELLLDIDEATNSLLLPKFGSLFLMAPKSAHDTLDNMTLLNRSQFYWQDHLNAIEQREGPYNRSLLFNTYETII